MRRPIAPRVVTVLCLALPASAQTLLRTISGATNGEEFGTAMIDAGDVNADGFRDVLVGAPGYNGDRGAVYCVSGKYLAHGTQPKMLWSVVPVADAGDRFGTSLALAGNLNSGSIPDFVVGAPGDDNVNGVDAGAVYVIDGASHALHAPVFGPAGSSFGFSLDGCGDQNGDALADVIVGGPGGTHPGVFVVSGYLLAYLGGSYSNGLIYVAYNTTATGLGWVVRGGFDIDHDGAQDFLVTSPSANGPGSTPTGRVDIRSGYAFSLIASAFGSTSSERFGNAADIASDYDGDGFVDVVVGAPNWGTGALGKQGRVVELSGYALAHLAPNPVIHEWTGSSFLTYFGTSVCASPDLNGDGIGDILVGGPGSGGTLGAASIFSGSTGQKMASYSGALGYGLGRSLVGALGDYTGDGFPEFVVAGAFADTTGLVDNGTLKCLELFPAAPVTYCTGKLNSLGCTPSMQASGIASATSAAAFTLTGSNFINQTNGILFYGYGAAATPFQGGTLCVQAPTIRTALQNAGGATSGASCTGVFALDFNARIQSAVDPLLTVGRQVFTQYWARDPQSASTTSLSNAISFLVGP
jgi:hypothetical protein